jgi:repressor LexA
VTTSQLLGEESLSNADDPLSTADNIFPITRKAFPLLGEIACGEPIYADESRESYIMAGTAVNADFCLRAKGDSMTGARILDGDIVFIKKMPVVENGSIAAVIVGDEATLKRVYYYPQQKKLVLNAENPKYEPFVYVGEELDSVRILGKAVAFQSDVL